VSLSRLFPILAIVALAGCAGAPLQRAHDLSTAGVAYAQASERLMDAAMTASIDADSFAKVAAQARGGGSKPSAGQLTKDLEKSDEELIVTLARYQQLRTSFATLGAYFAALQDLAANPQSDATASAVKALGDRCNEINVVLTKHKGLALPPVKIVELSGLSKLVGDQIHGAAVAAALRRDAATIGRTLVISQMAIRFAETDVRDYLALKQDAFYRNHIKRPYVAQTLGDQWVEDRRTYLKAVALGKASEDIKTAEAASIQMQRTWEKILAGDLSTAELHKMLSEINQLLTAVDMLKSAERPEKRATTQ